MMSQTYTVREVAQIIADHDDEATIDRLSRQIRHWTTENIVPTIGRKHGGTGVHRRYDDYGVRRAAVTAEFVKYGITISSLEDFGMYLDAIEPMEDWQTAVVGNESIFLTHSIASDFDGMSLHNQIGSKKKRNPLQIIEAMDNKDFGDGSIDVSANASVVVINLTKLFRRLKL